MRLLSLKLDTLAANMANVSTTGYKKDEVAAMLPDPSGAEAVKTAGYIDLSQGELVKTDNPFDLALEGEGFFVAGQGDSSGFTRDGRFSMDATGRLVVAGGLPVQGKSGPIVLDPALPTAISPDGSVTQAGKVVDRLKVVKFANPGLLRKSGGGLLTTTESGAEAQAAVKQGFVEGANVKMVEEMASLMQVMRNFDQIQKAMTSQDMATGKMIASLGKFY
jgi:flagellar basal body rod protein FlgG